MSTSRIQLLSDVLQAEIDRTGSPPPPAGSDRQPDEIPLSVRLDFAVLLTEAERAELLPPESPFGRLPALPPMLYAVWRMRVDLYRSFDLGTAPGYAGLWLWAVRDGRREIDVLHETVAGVRSELSGPATLPGIGGLPASCPWIAALLWCSRPDLQETYPLSDARSAADYLSWFRRSGVFESRCGDLLPEDHLRLLSSIDPHDPSLPLTRYVEFAHASRADLREAFDITGFAGRRDLLKWFFADGAREFPTHPDLLALQSRLIFEWGERSRGQAPPRPG